MNAIANWTRPSLLILLCFGAIGTMGNAVINNPTKLNLSKPTPYNFPENISLPDAQLTASKPLAIHTFKDGTTVSGQSYRYQQAARPIDIEIHYLTDGVAHPPDLNKMLETFTKIPADSLKSSKLETTAEVGYYSSFVRDKTAYFSTCINPKGRTTVTGYQFFKNNNPNPLANGIAFERLLPWLLGKQTLRDSRCLWTILSTPIDSATPDDTIKTLENTGINWIRWWQMHFPAA